jgi:predicted short-subunit dehydrogenase-like oxidoreductase (DUF2520 family)
MSASFDGKQETDLFELQSILQKPAMLPAMSATVAHKNPKPTITIVGAGNLASALAPALRAEGYVIDQIVARARPASLRNAKRLAAKVGASCVSAAKAQIQAQIVWFCVPDGQIVEAVTSLQAAADWKAKIALHSSGALTSNELSELRRRGASVASAHPLMTFVQASLPSLAGVPFAVEGDAAAVRWACRIVKDLGGAAYAIRPENKAAYHAWGMFTSPLLAALLIAGEHVAAQAGISRSDARRRMLPILKQTLANYERLGAAGAFSGPIVRGDSHTIERHLFSLHGVDRAIYVSLVRGALAYLPTKNPAAIEKALQSFERIRSRSRSQTPTKRRTERDRK